MKGELRRGEHGWRGLLLMTALIMVCLLAPNSWADETRVITVKKGDTVVSLCRQVYHMYTPEVAALLQQANPELTSLNQIRAGQKLRFPALSVAAKPTAAPSPSAVQTPVEPPAPAMTTRAAPGPASPAAPPQAGATGDQLAQVFFQETAPPNDLLPAGTSVAPGFEPAAGTPIGAVEKSEGQAWIIHQGSSLAYTAERDLPLFTGDTLVTDTKAQLRCRLDDKSTFALAGHSKLVLDKSIYDPEQDRRESVLQLLFGRARFIVNHLKGSYANDYQVRSPTAICGVRGSDFVVAVVPSTAQAAKVRGFRAALLRLAEFFTVRSAQAALGLPLTTTLLAGSNTTVGFSGLVGATQVVGAGSLSAAAAGGAAMSPLGVSLSVVGGALNSVGSLSAVMAMPPGLE